MLVGRTEECARIDGLLDAARAGRSGTLVLRGEPGIGKSALLDYASERADGMRILRALSLESESELPFSALDELTRPVLDRLDRLPDVQAEALRAALALGPAAEVDRFATYAATLGILAEAAEDGPVLCLIDDAHWLDTASAEALTFAGRRLQAEGIAMIFAAREGERRAFPGRGLADCRVGGLDADAAGALLANSSRELTGEVVTRLVELTSGNPLALLEIPRALRPTQLVGDEPLPDPLPVGASIEGAFLGRVKALSDRAQRALLVAAASDTGALEVVTRALAQDGLAKSDLEEAERGGLLELTSGELAFQHPLIRSVVYETAGGSERRSAHRALAEVMTGQDVADRRAWHLAAAALAPDEEAAAALEQAADVARGRAGVIAESRALERSAGLTEDGETRARRLLRAATAAWSGGAGLRAEQLAQEALSVTGDEALRADILTLRGNLLYWGGELEADRKLKLGEARRIEPVDPVRAADMMARATSSLNQALDAEGALALATRAQELMAQRGGDNYLARSTLARTLTRHGDLRRGGSLALDCAEEAGREGEAFRDACGCLEPLFHAEEYEVANRVLEGMIAAQRAAGAFSYLANSLEALSELEQARGRLIPAYTAALESLELSEQLDAEPLQLTFSVARLTASEALLGREADARRHASQAMDLGSTVGSRLVEMRTRAALGLLELSLGKPDEAVASLEPVGRALVEGGFGNPAFVQWAPELIESYAHAGRSEDAERALSTLDDQARTTESPWALGAAARCAGLIAEDNEFDEQFERALECHDRSLRVFEKARTELCYGQRLRRAKRRVDARARLRAALATFEDSGARLWAERARTELTASGETARQRQPWTADELTPQELKVALIVVEGATNREAATALFLSTKTIEFHLGNVYRKLGVRSRTELARRLATGQPVAPSAGQDKDAPDRIRA
jgi:DNA-binding CsgD family transcriptional regulator